jgi:RND family efflux transporter MFP subunit
MIRCMGTGLSIAALLAVVALLPACQEPNEFQAPPPPKVTVAKPDVETVTIDAFFTGTTAAIQRTEIRARVEGYLQKIAYGPGQEVNVGDLLFVIDPAPYEAEVALAKAELQSREADLALAKTQVQKLEKAFETRAVSQMQVIEAKAKVDVSAAAVEAAKARLKQAELELSYCEIRAPIKGNVERWQQEIGDLVGAGQATLLTRIVNDDKIYAYFNVSESALLKALQMSGAKNAPTPDEPGRKIWLRLENETDYTHEGHLEYTDQEVDEQTATLRVRAILDNTDQKLWGGLTARIKIPLGTADETLLVPERALGVDQRGHYLLTVDAENKVHYRSVDLGPPYAGGRRIIKGGIEAGDRVIVNGLMRARPGAVVVPEEEKPAEPAPAPEKPESPDESQD